MVVAHSQTVRVPYALILVLRFIEVLLHSEFNGHYLRS
jgi:hypothetical protein